MTVVYDFDAIASTGSNFVSLGSGPSINDVGQIAFQGTRPLGVTGAMADNVFAYDPLTQSVSSLMNAAYEQPNVGPTPTQTFSESVQVNNLGEVLARRALLANGVTLGTNVTVPLTYLEKWNANDPTAQPVQNVMASGSSLGTSLTIITQPNYALVQPTPVDLLSPFRLIYSESSMNNSGQVVFTALRDDGTILDTGPQPTGPRFLGTSISTGVRPLPSIADTGAFVISNATPGQLTPGGTIGVFPNYQFGTLFRIASTTNGFTAVSAFPSISDDGTFVAFLATLSSAGANTINAAQANLTDSSGHHLFVETVTPGTGVYVSFNSTAGRIIQKISGMAGNGVLDPGETFVDSNGNGILDGSEVDQGPISGYDATTRVAVAASQARDGTYNLVFLARDAANNEALFSSQLFVPLSETTGVPTGGADPPSLAVVLRVGQTIHANPVGDVVIQDLNIYDPLNASGQIAFWANTDHGEVVLRAAPRLRPVLIFPGIGGTFPTDITDYNDWFLRRGYDPLRLSIDPIAHVYDNLIQSFIDAGYRVNQNLFVATYDWRLNPGPNDGTADGLISGLSGASITAADQTGEFRYGVDYLGYWLKRATDTWLTDHPGMSLDSVDMIGHSTGGLVIRSYLQSDAYNDFYDGVHRLPKVENFVMYDVPNRGAPKAWSFLQDDWWIDADKTYPVVFRGTMNGAFRKVLQGEVIQGADHTIALSDLIPGTPSEQRRWADLYLYNNIALFDIADARRKFIRLYVPTIRSLLSTEDFLSENGTFADINGDDTYRNALLLDLNAGSDPNAFVLKASHILNIWGNGPDKKGNNTIVTEEQKDGTSVSTLAILTQHFDAQLPRPPVGTWYLPVRDDRGDGTVPYTSLATPFLNDSRVENFEFVLNSVDSTVLPMVRSTVSNDDVSHTTIVSNRDAIWTILTSLGADIAISRLPPPIAEIDSSRGFHLLLDPVSAYVVDSQGRRTGYDSIVGPLDEIPNGTFFGGANGIGFLTPTVGETYRLVVKGDGNPYYIEFSGRDQIAISGVKLNGVLARGQTITVMVPEFHDASAAGAFAEGEEATTFENVALKVPILANDFAAKGLNSSSVLIVQGPSHGVITFDPNAGELVYRPSPGYLGSDQVVYTVADTSGDVSNPATVSINVTPSPFLRGDYDNSGAVNDSDYVLWRTNFGSTVNLQADGTGDAVVDAADYVLWRKNAVPATPGDYDRNGRVDQLDYGFWRQNYGGVSGISLQADGNRNGTVDAADYVVWRKSLSGATPATGAATKQQLLDSIMEPMDSIPIGTMNVLLDSIELIRQPASAVAVEKADVLASATDEAFTGLEFQTWPIPFESRSQLPHTLAKVRHQLASRTNGDFLLFVARDRSTNSNGNSEPIRPSHNEFETNEPELSLSVALLDEWKTVN